MNKLVIDASAAISLCLADENSSMSERLLGELGDYQIIVPPHWGVEVANALLMAYRRKRIEFSEIEKAY